MTMLRDISLVENGRGESTDSRVGVPASEIPAGFALPAFLLNDIDAAYPNRLYALKITSLPSAGVLSLDKAGVGTFSDAPAGVYTGTQVVEKFDPGVGRVSRAESTYSITVEAVEEEPPTVTSVAISPVTATVQGGGTRQFTATATGTNNPPQTFTWETTLGQINASGLLTVPAATNAAQTGTVTVASTLNPNAKATATITVPAISVPVPTVTSVTVAPAGAILTGDDTRQFIASVQGANNPSQAVTWSTTLGTISASGVLTAPAATQEVQAGTVTATSVFDSTKSGSVSFTVDAATSEPETNVRTVSIVLGEAYGPAANLTGIMVSFHAASGPHTSGIALYQSSTESTDNEGVLSFTMVTNAIGAGEAGLLSVLMPDGRHFLGLVAVG